jgi:serine/threonine protein kinase
MVMERAGPYLLIGRLATGGMAEVFLARRDGPAGFEKIVVVKRILPQFSEDPDFRRMFLDEARLAALINHPNVAQIFDLSKDGELLYLAMEYVAGFDVARVMDASLKARRLVPPQVTARIIADACAGLDAAHKLVDARGRRKGVVHRDISPENLLVSEMGMVKVVDFGIARAGEGTAHTRSASGRLKGKVHYHSPEHIRDQPLDGRADVYALGVVLYELLCARRPFEGLSEIEVMRSTVEQDPPPPQKHYAAVDPELAQLALKALARDPANRPTAAELRDLLESWLRQHPCTAADVERFLLEVIPLDSPDRKKATELLETAPPSRALITNPDGIRPVLNPTPSGPSRIKDRSHYWTLGVTASLLLAASGVIFVGVKQARDRAAKHDAKLAQRTTAGDNPFAPILPGVGDTTGQSDGEVELPDGHKADANALARKSKGGGTLTVQVSPKGSEVSIDDGPSTAAPVQNREVPLGHHKVHVVNHGLGIDATRTVEVKKGQPTKLSLEFSKIPVALSVFPGAKVSVDGQDIGTTPMKLALYEGRHELRLTYGAQTRSVALDVKAGGHNEVRANFDKK